MAIKEMVKTKSNPGGPVEMYESAESGISPLMVIPRSTQLIEEEIRREEAAAESEGKRTQAEELRIKKRRSKAPTRKLV